MHPAADDLLGQKVGAYGLLAILDEREEWTRYLAEHSQLHKKAVCQVLRHRPTADDETERLIKTAQQLSRLRSPYIIDIFDSGTLPDGRPYLLLEHLDWRPLSDVMATQPLTSSEVEAVARQLCIGLAAASEAGVVHGGLKPEDVLILRAPDQPIQIKLTNFGSKRLPALEGDRYFAPEQKSAHAPTERSDVYLLGLILCELFAGVTPFDESDWPRIPSRIAAVLRRAVANDPVARQASAQQLLTELEHGLDLGTSQEDKLAKLLPVPLQPLRSAGAPVAAADTGDRGSNSPLQKKSDRSKWQLLAIVGGLLLLILSGLFFGLLLSRRPALPPVDGNSSLAELRPLAVAVLREGLAARDASLRLQALQGLSKSPDARFRVLIEPLLSEAGTEIRSQAIKALANLGSHRLIPALQGLLQSEKDIDLKLTYAEALLQLGDKSARATLGKFDHQEDIGVRVRAALALEEQGGTNARRVTNHLLAQSDDPIKLVIWLRRARRGDTIATEELVKRLPEQAPLLAGQFALAEQLARLEVEHARALLKQTAERPGPTQIPAAQALCAAQDASFLNLLRESAGSDARPQGERVLAADSLGDCGDLSDAHKLADGLHRSGLPDTLRLAMASALLRLTNSDPQVLTEQSISWAQGSLTNGDWSVRRSAVALLGDADPRVLSIRRIAANPASASGGLDGQALTPEALVALLLNARQDAQRDVRLAAIRSIGKQAERLLGGADPRLMTLRGTLSRALAERAELGDAQEQVVAAAALLRLDEGRYRSRLAQGLSSTDPEVRQLAATESTTDRELRPELLKQLLKDPDLGVRFAAAEALARRGLREGVEILRQALDQKGAEQSRAIAALNRLGESLPSKQEPNLENLSEMLSSQDPLDRLLAVELAHSLPTPDAVKILLNLVHDPDAAIRWRVAEVAAMLPRLTSPPSGIKVLRLLQLDDDISVRARAQSFLAGMLGQATPAPPTTSTLEPPAAVYGFLLVEAAAQTQFSIDGKVFAGPPKEALSLPPGTHTITWKEGIKTVRLLADQTTRVVLQISPVEVALSRGLSAVKDSRYSAAQLYLEQADRLCARTKAEKSLCNKERSNLSYHLGLTYENLRMWSRATDEYHRVLQNSPSDKRALAQQGMARLAGKLGHVVVYKQVKGRCLPTDEWLPPGNHLISDGKARKSIELAAGETTTVKLCQ